MLAARTATLKESATLALNARAKALAAEGKTVFNLTAGELATDTPKYIRDYVAKQLNQNKYTPPAGLLELRQAIAEHASDFYQQDFSVDNVVVTAGCKPGLYLSLLALLNPGDEVIVPTPMWVSYQSMIELAGGNVVQVPLNDSYDLVPELIEKAITAKTKAIILNSPQNPTGSIYSAEKLDELAKVLDDKDIAVIADDIYSKLVFNDSYSPVPTHDFDNIIIVNGFSKSQALTGWRIGYMIADTPVVKAATSMLSHVMGNAAVPSQLAAIAALKQSDAPQSLQQLAANRKLVSSLLDNQTAVSYSLPDGAFYMWLDLRKITEDSADWCTQLLEETGVALVPGEAFAAPGFARMSFVAESEILKSATEKIIKFAKEAKS